MPPILAAVPLIYGKPRQHPKDSNYENNFEYLPSSDDQSDKSEKGGTNKKINEKEDEKVDE